MATEILNFGYINKDLFAKFYKSNMLIVKTKTSKFNLTKHVNSRLLVPNTKKK